MSSITLQFRVQLVCSCFCKGVAILVDSFAIHSQIFVNYCAHLLQFSFAIPSHLFCNFFAIIVQFLRSYFASSSQLSAIMTRHTVIEMPLQFVPTVFAFRLLFFHVLFRLCLICAGCLLSYLARCCINFAVLYLPSFTVNNALLWNHVAVVHDAIVVVIVAEVRSGRRRRRSSTTSTM